MTIRDPDLKLARELRFAMFNGCFDGGISPSDIDAFVEVSGHFLFIEGKGPTLSFDRDGGNGQKRALKALARQPHTTVLLIGGEDPSNPVVMQRYPDGPSQLITGDDLREWVRSWCIDARGGRR